MNLQLGRKIDLSNEVGESYYRCCLWLPFRCFIAQSSLRLSFPAEKQIRTQSCTGSNSGKHVTVKKKISTQGQTYMLVCKPCCPELSWEQPSSESLRFWKEGQAHLIFCLLKLNLTDCSFVILCIYRNWLELGAYLFGGDNRHTNETELLYLCHVFIHAAPINLGFADRTMHTDCFLIKDIKVDGLRVDDKECV